MSLLNRTCRTCGHDDLKTILSLGYTPLANALLTEEKLGQPDDTYPLDLVFCPICTLVQITETVPPEKLFRDYVYFSSFSDTVLRNAKNISERIMSNRKLDEDSLVVEIASNDGYLLKNYQQSRIPVLGIEPARNIAQVAKNKGINTLSEFFNESLARKLRKQGKQADVIHANNVVAHVADLHGVVAGIATLLKPDGVAVVENHYIKDLIDHVEFDSIYHEHLCYYSVTSIEHLFRKHNLDLVDVELIPIHGGSIRVFFQRQDGSHTMKESGVERVERVIKKEDAWGVDQFGFYRDFGQKVEMLRRSLLDLLRKIKREGKRIAVYGASAKSTTFLSYFDIGSETVDFVVDRSTVKQGYYTPGTHLRIYSPEKLLEERPDYVLLLAWNFMEEIMEQQREYRHQGGQFIIPIPELEVI